MSIQHIIATGLIPLLFITVNFIVNDGELIKNRVVSLLIKGEDNIEYYFKILNLKFSKDSWLIKRFLISLLIGLAVTYTFFKDKLYVAPVMIFIAYKYFYLDLVIRYRTRIKTINQQLPYFLKMVVNGCYYRPLLGSLISASEFVFEEFAEDVNTLITEIDENPASYKPYNDLIEKYNNQIKHLDTYLKSLYRLSETSNFHSTELLETLSKMISDDINIVRAERNNVFNNSLSYLGLIPVTFLTISICSAMVLMIKNIL